jgi:hypothetical protein
MSTAKSQNCGKIYDAILGRQPVRAHAIATASLALLCRGAGEKAVPQSGNELLIEGFKGAAE